jgi:transcriptional regulator with XRE-family HTH domain
MDSDVLMKRLGLRLKALRLANRLKQEDLERFGFSYRYYGRIERGLVNPTLGTLIRLCEIFKTRLSDLFVSLDMEGCPLSEENEAVSLRITDILKEGNSAKIRKLRLFLDEFL